MSKSITSTISICLVGLILFTPLLTVERCDMPCCDTIEVSCCDSVEPMDCTMEMANCELNVFIPLVAAPLNEIDGKTVVDISTLVQTHSFFENVPTQFFIEKGHFQNHHPPNFHLPLLI